MQPTVGQFGSWRSLIGLAPKETVGSDRSKVREFSASDWWLVRQAVLVAAFSVIHLVVCSKASSDVIALGPKLGGVTARAIAHVTSNRRVAGLSLLRLSQNVFCNPQMQICSVTNPGARIPEEYAAISAVASTSDASGLQRRNQVDHRKVVSREGIEPSTRRLRVCCSTN